MASSTPPPRERFTLVLEALPSDVPAANRLRRLLKFALRGLGLKCLRLTGDTEDAQAKEQPKL